MTYETIKVEIDEEVYHQAEQILAASHLLGRSKIENEK